MIREEKPKPPKRRIKSGGIQLTVSENNRFLTYASSIGIRYIVDKFLAGTGLYLRGRCDGPNRSGTLPCGYVFLSADSFKKGHSAVLCFDPNPRDRTVNVLFRRWSGVLPFREADWKKISSDRLQKRMRFIDISSVAKLTKSVSLAKTAVCVFTSSFDITADLTQ